MIKNYWTSIDEVAKFNEIASAAKLRTQLRWKRDDTLKERYEDIYIEIHNVASILHRDRGIHANWVAVTQPIAQLVDASTSGALCRDMYFPVQYMMTLNRAIKVYRVNQPGLEMIVGYKPLSASLYPFYGNTVMQPESYGFVKISEP